jgi:hypothetical protein
MPENIKATKIIKKYKGKKIKMRAPRFEPRTSPASRPHHKGNKNY